jgi:lysophospholipase L1-like esterase
VVVGIPDYTKTPRGFDFGDPEQQSGEIARFNALLASICAERGIAFVDIAPVADRAIGDETLVANDLLHPSGEQYAEWVELIAPVVEGLFAR